MKDLHRGDDAIDYCRILLLIESYLGSLNEIGNREIRLGIPKSGSNAKPGRCYRACNDRGLPCPKLVESAADHIALIIEVGGEISAILQTTEYLLDLNRPGPNGKTADVLSGAVAVPISTDYRQVTRLKEV